MLEQHDRYDQYQNKNSGNGRCQGPVPIDEELIVEGLADHQRVESPQQGGNHELPQCRDEYQHAPGDNARHGQGQGNVPENLVRFAAEV